MPQSIAIIAGTVCHESNAVTYFLWFDLYVNVSLMGNQIFLMAVCHTWLSSLETFKGMTWWYDKRWNDVD